MNPIKLQINRAIAEIENINPGNHLISGYKDFLQHRDFLHYYKYNVAVIISLIDLTYNLWHTNERISRASLLAVTKRYFKKAKTKANIPEAIASKIFGLFKEIVYHENLKLSKEAVDNAKIAINGMMIGVKLKEQDLQWLCNHSNHSEFILNRILRYHLKSKVISRWAEENFEKDFARNRRSEFASWIIDKKQTFEIGKETFAGDFEYQIAEDIAMVEDYKNEMDSFRSIEGKLRPQQSLADDLFMEDDDYEFNFNNPDKPILNKPRRHYSGFIDMSSGYGMDIPDFVRIEQNFYDRFDYFYYKLMAWSIAYSRLSIDSKTRLLDKYFSDELLPTFLLIGKKLKSVKYYNWLEQKALGQD